MSGVIYGNDFYDSLSQGSLKSARVYLSYLFSRWLPSSAVDLGCGRGSWLVACKELGVQRLVGIDGNWVRQEEMVDPAIKFISADLSERLPVAERYDLALSLEVAEHLPADAAERFIANLTQLSDAVLFSAAFVGQPGINHINTRPHSYWAKKFIDRGYLAFDIFRQKFWSNDEVEPWYRQNAFIYLKPHHPLFHALTVEGYRACENIDFLDCIHPWLYFGVLNELWKQSQPLLPTSKTQPPQRPRRNDLCYCGSGKRFKHCHGKGA
jgi:SAM-dependent methyltransferase